MDSKKLLKVAPIFDCKYCDYTTSKKSSYLKHLSTDKHKNSENDSKMVENDSEKLQKVAHKFLCTCGKTYKYDSGYYRHKKMCFINESQKEIELEENKTSDIDEKNLIMMLIKQNTELLEIVKNGTNNTTNNNSHNKTFNLNMFLNETCKNAMNINEFVDSLQLQMSDLENVGESGYIEGISSIIIKKLNTLDITERPIHCTDKKRETMYIKDQDKWEKEDEKKTKMHKLVTKVANKNINMISEFQKLHPEWKKCSSKYADQHNKIVIESMGGKGDNEYEKQEKIIKKIAKEVFVEKCL
jgi:hypothetical protein